MSSLVLPPTVHTKKKKPKKSNSHVSDVLSSFAEESGTDAELVYDRTSEYENRVCVSCSSPVRQTMEDGFEACTNAMCGKMRTDILDGSPEWRYYSASDGGLDPTRCGLPVNPLLHESSYGCRVACGWRASYEMRKVRRYTEWQAMPYREKARYDEFERIRSHANRAGLPKIAVDSAYRYHTIISTQRTFRGLNRDGIIAASIYIACRVNQIPRTAKEIAVVFRLDAPSATRGCKNAMTILNSLERDNGDDSKSRFEKTSPEDFVDRYCSKLGMSSELVRVSSFVAMKVHNCNLIPENTPHAVAAGIVYFVAVLSNAAVTKKDVSIASDISEVTINKCYKKLAIMQEQLVPQSVVDRLGS
jgi:transcription initiation factor TFIIB